MSNGGWTAAAFVNYVDSYEDVRFSPAIGVDSWTTFDLNVSYDFEGLVDGSIPKSLRASVTVQNLFDSNPPFVVPNDDNLTQTFYDPANANPLGRFAIFKLTTEF